MRYLALATDYDGTLAWQGLVSPETIRALERVHASGRRLILVTGRELDDLLRVFPSVALFERVVAENGAVLYQPGNRDKKVLAEPPAERFIRAMRERHIEPLAIGEVIVATSRAHDGRVLEVIDALNLQLEVSYNKDSVMVLPIGVTKATGLAAALADMELSREAVVGIGDAENDVAFLGACAFGVAVANAIPALKERADWVTPGEAGAGVTELIDKLVATDLDTQRYTLAG